MGADGVAPATQELAGAEVCKIIEECYEEALATLRGSQDRLDRLARILLDRGTLDEDDAHAAAGIDREGVPAAIARGGAAGTSPAPAMPPAAARTGGDGAPAAHGA